jgi:predicted phage tail protein
MTLRTVHLYGALKDEFGGPYKFDVNTPAEAARALAANFREFIPRIRQVTYAVFVGDDIDIGENYGLDRIHSYVGNNDIHIMPVVEGAKSSNVGKGLLQTIVGATLVAVGILTANSICSCTRMAARTKKRCLEAILLGLPNPRTGRRIEWCARGYKGWQRRRCHRRTPKGGWPAAKLP